MSVAILGETLSYLRFNCIWPKVGQDLKPGKSYYIKFVLMTLSTTVLLIGSASHLVVSIRHNSNNISEDLIIVIAETGVYYFISIFVLNQRNISKIYADLSDFEKLEKPRNFDKHNQKMLFLSKIYKYIIDVAAVNFWMWPFVNESFCKKKNEHRDFREICGLLVTTWVPFDVDYFPVKQLLYVWQCYSIVMTMKGAAVISFAIMESVEHLIVRIQHCKFLLLRAVATDDDALRQKRFSTFIQYHIDIFDVGRRIDKYHTGCLFLHVILTGALFGCIGYQTMEGFAWNMISIFNGWLLSLLIVCYSGQNLINEVLSVAEVAYDSKWYERDVEFQKNILLIILRSQKPIIVHAGPFSYLSHEIILTIFNTAYSYLTLLSATST